MASSSQSDEEQPPIWLRGNPRNRLPLAVVNYPSTFDALVVRVDGMDGTLPVTNVEGLRRTPKNREQEQDVNRKNSLRSPLDNADLLFGGPAGNAERAHILAHKDSKDRSAWLFSRLTGMTSYKPEEIAAFKVDIQNYARIDLLFHARYDQTIPSSGLAVTLEQTNRMIQVTEQALASFEPDDSSEDFFLDLTQICEDSALAKTEDGLPLWQVRPYNAPVEDKWLTPNVWYYYEEDGQTGEESRGAFWRNGQIGQPDSMPVGYRTQPGGWRPTQHSNSGRRLHKLFLPFNPIHLLIKDRIGRILRAESGNSSDMARGDFETDQEFSLDFQDELSVLHTYLIRLLCSTTVSEFRELDRPACLSFPLPPAPVSLNFRKRKLCFPPRVGVDRHLGGPRDPDDDEDPYITQLRRFTADVLRRRDADRATSAEITLQLDQSWIHKEHVDDWTSGELYHALVALVESATANGVVSTSQPRLADIFAWVNEAAEAWMCAQIQGLEDLLSIRMPPGLAAIQRIESAVVKFVRTALDRYTDDQQATDLVARLRESQQLPRAPVKSTLYEVRSSTANDSGAGPSDKGKGREEDAETYRITSWKTVEFAYRATSAARDQSALPTLARGLFTVALPATGQHRILLRGYDKFFNVGELSFTKPEAIERYSQPPYEVTFKENGCIIFISALSPAQLIVTSKHALDRPQESQQSRDDTLVDEIDASDVAEGSSSQATKPTHAGKGHEWLRKHLASVGRSESQLAAELWTRNETAVAELCDDSFEEHVLAYAPERSGLHLHGLNANTVEFRTRAIEEVEQFAHQWGFLATRYVIFDTLAELKEFTDSVGITGKWQDEAIEGFVVRTSIAHRSDAESATESSPGAPPYLPGQAWFYKVKYDEPYLMYRDWRELAKKMIGERGKWEREVAPRRALPIDSLPEETEAMSLTQKSGSADDKQKSAGDQKKSKNQLKREAKAKKREHLSALGATSIPRPPPPKPRSNRPETKLFVQWCYDKLWGSSDGRVRPEPSLFEGINVGKGIIRLRDTYLAYLETPEGRQKLVRLGGAQGVQKGKSGETVAQADVGTNGHERELKNGQHERGKDERGNRPFTHLLVVPIAVPGCGKTSLFVALRHLFPGLITHTQSDDVKTKKSAPQFLKNICEALSKSRVVLADRNNHLLKHRDEIVEAVRAWEDRGGRSEEAERAEKKARYQAAKSKGEPVKDVPPPASDKPRVQVIALPWALDSMSLNALHRLMADRIVVRGAHHQSLLADTDSAIGSRSHETILWRFLETLEPLGHALGKGEGDKGHGDACFDEVVTLDVGQSQEQQLQILCDEVLIKYVKTLNPVPAEIISPTPQTRQAALLAADDYRKSVTHAAAHNEPSGSERAGRSLRDKPPAPRYYGLAVEVDLATFLGSTLEQHASSGHEVTDSVEMLQRLQSDGRINARPHITLVHSTAAKRGDDPTAQMLWKRYEDLLADKSSGPLDFEVIVGEVRHDDRVMALVVKDIVPITAKISREDFWQGQGRWAPHVTVGTRDGDVRPFEAASMVVAGASHVLVLDQACRFRARLAGMM